MHYRTVESLARWLERIVIGLAVVAVVYRAILYPLIDKPPGASWGNGDVIDFALGLLLFLSGGLCAASGIALSAMADNRDRGAAYRPVLIGMTTFVVYYLVHPYIPFLL